MEIFSSSSSSYHHHNHNHHHMEIINNGLSDNNSSHLPPGFRFHPTDEELITYYLLNKVLDSSFTGRAIAEVDLNKCEPWQLPEKAKMGEKEWYFYSLRDRKYPTGLRTNRATEAGYWKATGKDREIYSSKTCSLVGMKKTLVFYRGRAPKGEKSNWDEWVISRVFQKNGASNVTGSGTRVVIGSKKTRISSNSYNNEPGSPSSVSLPPLLDSSSPFPPVTNSNVTITDRDGCSYDSQIPREHVSCFSTFVATGTHGSNDNNNNNNGFNNCFDQFPAPVFTRTSAVSGTDAAACDGGVSAFPSLRSLQENLQLPFLFPSPSPGISFYGSGGSVTVPSEFSGCNSVGNWPSPAVVNEDVKNVGATELDCMWSY
ncbi:hypothetical protein CsatB_000211 [Cannabis sativa]